MLTLKIQVPALHPAQQAIKNEARRFNVVCCGRRFGKTTLGIDLIVEAALDRHLPTAWFSDKFASLDEPWRELKRTLRAAIRQKSETLRRIELVGGGSIKMWSLDDDPQCSRGPAYGRIVIDEAAKCAKLLQAWREAIRANLADYAGDAWFLSTPKGRNDFWQLFREGSNKGRPEWASWQMPTSANPYISVEEIAAMRREMGAVIASQEVDAQFLEVGGRFFDEWDEERHTCLPHPIPAHWRFFGGIDYGTRAASPTFCFLLCAADEAGRVSVIDELYLAGALPSAQAAAAEEMIRRHVPSERRSPLIAFDWANTFPPENPIERIGEYPVEAFWARGLRCVRAVKDREAGWTRVKEYLHRPGALTVFRGRCPNLIRTLPLMVYDERLGHLEDLDTSQEDHACDALRYALMTRPGAAPAPDPPPLPADHRPLWMKRRRGKVRL